MSFEKNLAAKFDHLVSLHPALLAAVPPEPIEPRYGTFRLNVAEFWSEFCAHEWRPRAGRDENLVGPFRCYGGCLAPFTQEGELHWYDTKLPARDGDVVLVRWVPEVLQAMYERNGADADWLRRYGEPCPVATKVYKTNGSSQWLLTRKSIVPLGENTILGVLRRRVRDGAVVGPVVSAIELEAATALIIVTASSFTTPLADLETNIATISAPAVSADYTAILTASCERWVTGSASGAALFIAYLAPGPAVSTLTGTYTNTVDTASPGSRVTLSGQLTVPVGTARDFYFRSIKGAGTAQHECRNVNFQLEMIKR